MVPNELDLRDVVEYVENNIGTFHQKRLEKLEGLRLTTVLRKKNPYLFKAKNILTAEALVTSILDAYLSSQEETMFGDFLEGVAIFICDQVYDGQKPSTDYLEGIDLIFENGNRLFIVEIKSGPNWGNSSQIKRMLSNFNSAKVKLKSEYPDKEVIAVNGCSYGKDRNPAKTRKEGTYLKLCGQDFWQFISSNDDLYAEIVEPLGYQAKERNEEFQISYAKIINKFTLEFGREYCDPDGALNWEKLVHFVSQRVEASAYPLD